VLNRELQSQERAKTKLVGIDQQTLISFEMGNDDITLICTYGKITFLCNQNTSDYTIGLILKSISAIDNSTSHEMEIVCGFDDIQSYQRMGYTLVTYGKHVNQYRVTYNIPFSSEKAVYNLTLFLYEELQKEKSLKKDFYWNGRDYDINQLYKELKNINGWKTKSIKNKE
jgi:hypothetical protein